MGVGGGGGRGGLIAMDAPQQFSKDEMELIRQEGDRMCLDAPFSDLCLFSCVCGGGGGGGGVGGVGGGGGGGGGGLCVYACMKVCICGCMYVCIYVHIYVYTSTYIYIEYSCTYTYTLSYICTYTYILSYETKLERERRGDEHRCCVGE